MIKFRLIKNDIVVGFERHVLIDNNVSIMHAFNNDGIRRLIYPDYKHWIPHDNKEQFTGLKDKNGKEIYEGNIVVVYEYLNGEVNKNQLHTAKIVACEGGWTIEPCWCHQSINQTLEIIGNIHENPELLKSYE